MATTVTTRGFAASTRAWRAARKSDAWATRAVEEGMRSRAAYKLQEINERFGRFLRPGANVVDLGAAPGGFSALAAPKLNLRGTQPDHPWNVPPCAYDDFAVTRTLGGHQPRRKHGRLVCVDISNMDEIGGAKFVQSCVHDAQTLRTVTSAFRGEEADVILSDMAPATTSDPFVAHCAINVLADAALKFCNHLLRGGGTLVVKLFAGPEERELRQRIADVFTDVRAFKPKASKKHSKELYLVARRFVPPHLRQRDSQLCMKQVLADIGLEKRAYSASD